MRPSGAGDGRGDFLHLYDDMLSEVFGYLVRHCDDVAVAERLTSQTFVHAASDAAQEPAATLCGQDLLTLARRKLVDHWGAEREPGADHGAAPQGQPIGRVDEPGTNRGQRALRNLPTAHRCVLALVHVDGLDIREAADLLGVGADDLQLRLGAAESAFARSQRQGPTPIADALAELRSPAFPLRPDSGFASALRRSVEGSWPGAGLSTWHRAVVEAMLHDDVTLVDTLDRVARQAMGEAPQQLGPLVGQLLARSLPLDAHPWACLVLTLAARNSRPPHPSWEGLLHLARRQLAESSDRQAQGYLAFVEGQVDFERGQLMSAADWYRVCRDRLGADSPLDAMAAAFEAMGAYWRGDLRGARSLALEAAAQAGQHHDRAAQAFASLVVAFCDLNSGEFELAARYLADAVGFYAGLTDAAERTHLPLAYAGLGVLHALRGHRAQAFDAFQKGIREAEANADGILRAAVLAAMAEFTAEFDCEGAAAAAQEALDFLKAAGERWWITWAQRALGLAFLYRGDPDMASLRLQPLTELDLSPLEMARTHLYLGEAAIVASDVRRARTALGEAVALLRNIGSKLLLARALLALASLDVSPVTSPRAAAVEVIRAQTDVAYGRLLPPLEICLLGTAQVSVDHKVRRFRTTRAKELVFYLLLASRNQLDREPLGLKWWRGSPSAKRSQNVADTISLARTGLGSEGWRLTTPEHGIVALDRRWIAVDYFDASAATDTLSRMSEPIGLETRLQAEQLLALLRNPLLPAWADEDWVQKEDAIRQRKVRDLEAFLKRQCR